MSLTITGVEKRLQDRYQRLVQEHTGHAHPVASGPRILPDQSSPEAAAQAAWRFYLNPRTTSTRLAQPLLQAARDAVPAHCQDFALVPLDWSKLDFRHHPSKTDCIQIGQKEEQGYKLLSALLVGDRDGQPLAPLCAQLQTAEGLLSSRSDRSRPVRSALDELAPLMGFVRGLGLGRRPVFLIDAEADSVYHYRLWQRRGFLFVVRADQERYATWRKQEWTLPQLRQQLQEEGAFARTREVQHQGQQVGQYVACAAVTLTRPGVLKRWVDGKQKRLKKRGKPLAVRLVIGELRDPTGQVLERWYLLSNVPATVTAATIALWYLGRWKIETFFKLLKSAGQEVEHWQQENGRALLKRLLVASMACVLAWRLAHSAAPQAAEARRVVMSLSGRQVEHGKEYTLEGLLAGTWVLLALVAVLQWLPVSRLTELADFVLSGSVEPALGVPLPLRKAG